MKLHKNKILYIKKNYYKNLKARGLKRELKTPLSRVTSLIGRKNT